MYHIGTYNVLKVKKIVKGGCYLDGGSLDIYLPKKDTPRNVAVGDELEVFIYNDAKESLKATTQKPLAIVGEFAYLRVKDVTHFGVFCDWGIEKDLFVPQKYILTPLKQGQKVFVYVILDYEKKGIIGSCTINRYVKKQTNELEKNQKVELLFLTEVSIGYKVIINNMYMGLVYKNEIFEKIHIGDIKTGYIKGIRDNGTVDVALQQQGFIPSSTHARDIVLKALREHKGFLPLTDKTDPQRIKDQLKLSKKMFKKVVGMLFKEKKIFIGKDGIRLI